MKINKKIIILLCTTIILLIFAGNLRNLSVIPPLDDGGAIAPICTTDNTIWKCGSAGSCNGLFYIKKCCEYTNTFEGYQIITTKEYFYCDESDKFWNSGFKGSDYGTIKIYLATASPLIDSNTLNTMANDWKDYLYEASYGMLDNVEFITESNADYFNLETDLTKFGSEIKAFYFFDDNYPENLDYYFDSFNANINWLFSSANSHSHFPLAWTTLSSGSYNGDCLWNSPNGYSFVCEESTHELIHALFGCDDYEGNILRPLPDLRDFEHIPPICLERIKYYMPQVVASSNSSTCTPKTCSQLGKQCGNWNNLCGGSVSCGSCNPGYNCNNGICSSLIDCTNKECGYNGYNGTCGSCNPGYNCVSNHCVLVNNCQEGSTCFDDAGCPGVQECNNDLTFGECVSNLTKCSDGSCKSSCPQPCTETCSNKGYVCGTQRICGSNINCGSCEKGGCSNGKCIEKDYNLIIGLVIGVILLVIIVLIVKSRKKEYEYINL